ncbi:MAG: type VI secretion system lipoprotein TssJ [Gammaproteobacteria bacterium]
MSRRLLILLLSLTLVGGCATTAEEEPQPAPAPVPAEPPPAPEVEPTNEPPVVPFEGWVYERNAITMRVSASANLNQYRERKHTLVLGIYQLADPNAFNTLRADPAGLQTLLTKGADADPSIVAFNKTVIRPGATEFLQMDRAASAKHVGVVAGYYELTPTRVSKVVPIIAIQDEKVGFWARLNPLADPPPPRPARVTVWLDLGSTGITELVTREQ